MTKPKQLVLNAQDISSANVSFEILQVLIDMLVKKGVLDAAEIHRMWKTMEQRRRKLAETGNPLRRNINESGAQVAAMLAAKYAPASKKH